MRYLNLSLSKIVYYSLYKQRAVPSRHENVRQVYYHNCIRRDKSKTKRIGGEPFQQQKKHHTNEILTYKSTRQVHRDNAPIATVCHCK